MIKSDNHTLQLVVKQRSFSTIQVGKKVVNGVFKPEVLREVYDMMKSIESIKGIRYFIK